eukprot:SAG11_NODE_1050_length_6025_cov_5.835974_1_plen_111_part_00
MPSADAPHLRDTGTIVSASVRMCDPRKQSSPAEIDGRGSERLEPRLRGFINLIRMEKIILGSYIKISTTVPSCVHIYRREITPTTPPPLGGGLSYGKIVPLVLDLQVSYK